MSNCQGGTIFKPGVVLVLGVNVEIIRGKVNSYYYR